MNSDAAPLSFCAVIPVYNHHSALEKIALAFKQHNIPVIFVNDGSNAACKAAAIALTHKYSHITLCHHKMNQGKGAAVKTGLNKALQLGFSHAIQVDADCQHNLDDIRTFTAVAQKHSNALVLGYPEYDASVPKHRYYARYLTHIWIWINTLSLSIRDTMCGFRAYPVARSCQLVNTQKIGNRMDFDSDFVVRWFWAQEPIVQQETKVTYPEDGISTFRPFRDNMLISLMHARLFLGMLLRFPMLLLKRNTAVDAK